MKIMSIVSISLDIFCPQHAKRHGKKYIELYKNIHSEEWIRKRIEFFRQWTLKSLHNQSFQDFQVWMLCSEKSKPIIDSYDWDENITHCYDYGEARSKTIDADYITMTNLDSDDLFHRDIMRKIRENLILSDKVERILTTDYYRWLFHHNCFIHVVDPLVGKSGWSPCWTLIFPRNEWNWPNIKKLWFVYNPQICQVPGAKTFASDLVCQIRIKEGSHCTMLKEDPLHENRLTEELTHAEMLGRKAIFSSDEHIKILEDFGISKIQYQKVER